MNNYNDTQSTNNERDTLTFIQSFLENIHSSLHRYDCYPVFGAIGNTFIIEFSKGAFESRNIIKTLYIDIKHNLDTDIYMENNTYTSEELIIYFKYEYILITTLYIIRILFKHQIYILHPLNNNGNYLNGWDLGM